MSGRCMQLVKKLTHLGPTFALKAHKGQAVAHSTNWVQLCSTRRWSSDDEKEERRISHGVTWLTGAPAETDVIVT